MLWYMAPNFIVHLVLQDVDVASIGGYVVASLLVRLKGPQLRGKLAVPFFDEISDLQSSVLYTRSLICTSTSSFYAPILGSAGESVLAQHGTCPQWLCPCT